jgi:hypothetical protein
MVRECRVGEQSRNQTAIFSTLLPLLGKLSTPFVLQKKSERTHELDSVFQPVVDSVLTSN